MKDDLIRDILARVMALSDSFTEAQALQIEAQVRHDWGGERVFVAKTQPEPRRGARHSEKTKRAAIVEVEQGTPPAEAARKHGISRARIYQLLKRE